jgi:hypothetical protein
MLAFEAIALDRRSPDRHKAWLHWSQEKFPHVNKEQGKLGSIAGEIAQVFVAKGLALSKPDRFVL